MNRSNAKNKQGTFKGHYLNAGGVRHSSRSKHEANKNPSDRTEMNANLAKTRVYQQIHDGDENDECDGIEVL